MYWMGLNWQQASDYCGSLLLGGSSGWRLPSLDEVKDAAEIIRVNPDPVCPSADVAIYGGCRDQDLAPGRKYSGVALRGRINLFDQSMTIWTATLSRTNSKSAWTVGLTPIPNSFISLVEITKASLSQTDSESAWESELKSVQWTPLSTAEMTETYMGVVCVRPIESNLLQTAKAAAVDHPVPDIQTLQSFIPLNNSRLAYRAGNYEESIAQAQIAISLKADPAVAYWGIGISYGRLGQWDQAIANLQTALSIDKNSNDAKTALKWAKDGLKAAKKGKQPKEPSPTWN
jgi:tetratricopeptide (TPR) repeat protein